MAAAGDSATTTQTMSANVSPFGKLSLPATVNLQSSDTRFGSSLAGSLTVSYWARTSPAAGSAITVQAGSELTPAGGPSIRSVNYLCSGATLGTGCSGVHSLSISTQSPLVFLPSAACTGGGGACSTQDPNTVLVLFSVPNEPHYKTGTYSALITFTISTL
jgi:fermentation-respiration switch protein FrsA (DUF1100 family)